MGKSSAENESIKAFSEATNAVRDAMRQFVQRRLRERQIDLTFEMLQVMRILMERSEVNQQEIANCLRKDKASITYLVDNLGKRRLVTREPDPNDGRNNIVKLTPAGVKMKQQLLAIVKELHEITGKNQSTGHLQKVTQALEKIKKNIEAAE